MDGLVWFGVIATIFGAALFAFGMRHDPILAAAIPGGSGLLMVVLLYLILSVNAPTPVSQSMESEPKQAVDRPLTKSNGDPPQDILSPVPSQPATAQPGEAVDLLARIDPRQHTIYHSWSMQDGALVSAHVRSLIPSRLWIPYRPPESYQLTAVVERLSGTDSINFGFPLGGQDVMVCIDGYQNHINGINLIDGRTADRNESRRFGQFIQGSQPHTIVCTVGPNSVHVTVNGRVAVDWKGDVRRLSHDRRWPRRKPGYLHLGCWQSSYRISKLELKPRS